ncbi:MAG: AAA family ATPase [Massilia sp.]
MLGKADPALVELAGRPYNLMCLCAPDFEFVQDGTRRDEDHRARQHAWYAEQLALRGVDYVLLRGSVAERIAQAAPYFVAAARTAPN